MSITKDFEEIRQLIGRIGSFDSRRSIKKADDTAYYQLAEADLKIKEFEKQLQSLQTKLQQAKEGLEFYAKAKHFEEHSHYDIMLEWGEKAREALEIINKE